MRKLIEADYKATLKSEPSIVKMIVALLQVNGFRLSVLYRVAHIFRIKSIG